MQRLGICVQMLAEVWKLNRVEKCNLVFPFYSMFYRTQFKEAEAGRVCQQITTAHYFSSVSEKLMFWNTGSKQKKKMEYK